MTSKFDRWMGIANLVVSLTTGAIIVLYTTYRDHELKLYLNSREEQMKLYLNDRSESLQKELISIKSQTDKSYGLASTELNKNYCEEYLCSIVVLKNNGPDIARNLVVQISLNTINDNWKGYLTDINFISVRLEPSSILSRSEDIIGQDYQHMMPQNNNDSRRLYITSLAPNQSVGIFLGVDSRVETKSVTQNISLGFDMDQRELDMYGTRMVDRYLHEKFTVANLIVDMSCDNCTGPRNVTLINVYSIIRTNLPVDPIRRSGEGLVTVSPTYRLPPSIDVPNDDGPIHLEVIRRGESAVPELYERATPKQGG